MSSIDDALAGNESYASNFEKSGLASPPAKKLVVLACMDARIDVHKALGLEEGDAHVIRNAGGIVTDDEIRSIAISQHLLGTTEVMLIHHTGCGLLGFTDDEFAERMENEAGQRPEWDAGSFDDLDDSVRASMNRIVDSPFIPHKDAVRGFVYEVETGKLREVT